METPEDQLEVESSVSTPSYADTDDGPNKLILIFIYCLIAVLLLVGVGIMLYTVGMVLGG
jgi:hypothetical protein